jgi:hypothetical protein
MSEIEKLQEKYDDLLRLAFQYEERYKFARAEDLFEDAEIVRLKLLRLKREAEVAV